jgi:hypothetical protein
LPFAARDSVTEAITKTGTPGAKHGV